MSDGTDSCDVSIVHMPRVSDNSKVFVYVPGSGGFRGTPETSFSRPPQPCILICIHLGGKGAVQGKNAPGYTRPMPPVLIQVLDVVWAWAGVGPNRAR